MPELVNSVRNRRPSKRDDKNRRGFKKTAKTVLRTPDERIGKKVVIDSAANRGSVNHTGQVGEIVEIGANPSLVLVRTPLGSCWANSYTEIAS